MSSAYVSVTNELGMGRPRAAKYSVYVTVFESLVIGIIFMIIVLVFRDKLALIYTNDAAYLLGLTGYASQLRSASNF
ncbi:Multi antimicrobial extrusion protein, partial [Trema orientale]